MKILFLLASVLLPLASSQLFSTRNGLPFQSNQQQQPMFQSVNQQPFQQHQQPMFQSVNQQPFQQQQRSFGQQPNQQFTNQPQARFTTSAGPQTQQFGPGAVPQMGQFTAVPNNQFVAAAGPGVQQQQAQFVAPRSGFQQNDFVPVAQQPAQFAGAVPKPQGKIAVGVVPQQQQFAGMAPQTHQFSAEEVAVAQQQQHMPQVKIAMPGQQANQFAGGMLVSQTQPSAMPQGKIAVGVVPQQQQFAGMAPQTHQFSAEEVAVAQQQHHMPQVKIAMPSQQANQFAEGMPVSQSQQNFMPNRNIATDVLPQQQQYTGMVPEEFDIALQQQQQVKIAGQQANQFAGVNPQPIQVVSQAKNVRVEQPQELPTPPVAIPIQQQQSKIATIVPIQQQFSSRPVNRLTGGNVPNIPRFCSFRGHIECDPNFPYRTLNGSCNNLNNLWWGKAETPFKRLIEPDYADKINEPRISVDGGELPNPYEISCTLHREAHEIEPFVTHIFMQFGQAVSHDISSLSLTTDEERNISTCDSCTRTQKCLPMPINQNVSCGCINQMRHQCLEFVRSSAAFSDLACQDVRREQLNLQTSFLDASIIYGIVESDIAPLMEGRGRFRMQPRHNTLLPDMTQDPSDCMDFTDDRRCFLAGDNRVNQQPGLMLLQTLWVREHNRIANILGSLNPKWNDRTVFEETRRVVIAEMQHITYSEYLPVLLGESVMRQMGLTPLQGSNQANVYDPTVDPRTANEFAAGAGRFGHSMVRSIYTRADSNYNTIGTFMLRNQYFRSNMFYDDDVNGGLESVARGFLKDPSMKVDQFFTEDVSRHLFETMDDFGRPFHFDLVSLNIQRGREHGLPAYVKFRDLCRLTPVRSWEDMRKFIPSEVVDIFMSLYRFVEDVDFYSAGLAEFKVSGSLLGPTFNCVVARTFRDLKFGDRFWYETNQAPASFTPAQLAEIRKYTFAKLLCRNLKNTPQIQPLAMLSSKLKGNNLVNCVDLPDINWSLWRV